MNRKGFTVPELVIGIACAAVIGLVSTALFKAGVTTYNYTIRQNSILISASNALSGNGAKTGILSSARQSKDISALNTSSLVLLSTASNTTTFALAGENMTRTENGATVQLATGVSTVTFRYYNLAASGLIMVSTAANTASLVTTNLVVKGKFAKQRDYIFYGAARLRNHQ